MMELIHAPIFIKKILKAGCVIDDCEMVARD